MRKLVVTEWMTLDGVVQAPGTPDADTSPRTAAPRARSGSSHEVTSTGAAPATYAATMP